MCLPNLRILQIWVKLYCTGKIIISSLVNFHTYLKGSKEIKGERMFPYISVNGEKNFKWQTGTCWMKSMDLNEKNDWGHNVEESYAYSAKCGSEINLCKASEDKTQEIIEC